MNIKVFLQLLNTESCPVQTYSLVLLGGLEMGYLGEGLLLGQDAASIAPPTTTRNAPAQAMKMADPNSYLKKEVTVSPTGGALTSTKQTCMPTHGGVPGHMQMFG